MQLSVAILLLQAMMITIVGCNNNEVTNLSNTADNRNDRALFNVKSGINDITQHSTVAGNDDDDAAAADAAADAHDAHNNHTNSETLPDNRRSVDVDELALVNTDEPIKYLHDASNNNNNNASNVITFGDNSDFDTVVDISSSLSNNNHNNQTNVSNVDHSTLSTENAAASVFLTLPSRHQRAIAEMSQERGLLQRAAAASGERILRRGKRYLQFAKGSRVSWRTTGKNNIFRTNTMWGYGYGFRANFPFPGPEESRRPFFKRDVLHSLADVLDGHGLDGRACILKSYCTAALDVDSNISGGMLFKMLKLIFTLKEYDKRHLPFLRLENCKQILHSHCPLSFNSISTYTDDL